MATFVSLDARRTTLQSFHPDDEVVLVDDKFAVTLSLRNPRIAGLLASTMLCLACASAEAKLGSAAVYGVAGSILVSIVCAILVDGQLRASTAFFRDVLNPRLVWSARLALVNVTPFLLIPAAFGIWGAGDGVWTGVVIGAILGVQLLLALRALITRSLIW